MQLVGRIRHDRQRGSSVDESAKIHLPQRYDEARVDRQQQEEIQFARAHELGEVRAVDQKERLEYLLDEMTGPDQEDDFPFGPGADVLSVQVEHADEAELEAEPEQFDDD